MLHLHLYLLDLCLFKAKITLNLSIFTFQIFRNVLLPAVVTFSVFWICFEFASQCSLMQVPCLVSSLDALHFFLWPLNHRGGLFRIRSLLPWHSQQTESRQLIGLSLRDCWFTKWKHNSPRRYLVTRPFTQLNTLGPISGRLRHILVAGLLFHTQMQVKPRMNMLKKSNWLFHPRWV